MYSRATASRLPSLFLLLALIVVLASSPFLVTGVLAQNGPPQLPPQAQAQQFEGELEVEMADFDSGSELRHFLKTTTGRFKLEFLGEGPGLPSGTKVRARGRLKDATTLELGSGGDVEPMALANGNTFGEQRTIVILVNFQDLQTSPYSPGSAASVTFQTTSDYYFENSNGQTWLTGDVVGWYTLPMNSTACDYYQISSLADQAATAGGAKLSNYSRKIYAFPKISACAWWGLGTVGGNPSRAWVNGTYSLKVVAHELGHNYGDYHSRSMSCDASGCSVSEYGDNADVMGNPTSGHMNAFQKERLGWLNYGDTPAALSVGSSGSYWIDAYSLSAPASSAPKALKILKSVDGAGNRTWYYVEARAKIGFDSGVSPGVILHTGSEATGNSSYQLDMTPTLSGFDSRLDAGQTFEDSALGVRVTTLWADATGAMIDVQFDAAPCTAVTPALSASPGGTVSTAAGTPVTYAVSLSNLDGAACGSSTFDFDAWVPSGWTASFSPSSANVAAGGSASSTLTVTPSASATGSSDIQIGAYRSGSSGASVVRTVSISAPPPPPSSGSAPSSVNLSVGMSIDAARGGYTISVTVTDGSSPVSGAQVSFTITDPAGGARSFNASTDSSGVAWTNYKPRKKDPTGTYSVQAVVSLGEATATATGLFVVK